MKLALQIGLGIVIGVFGCWIVGIFSTAAIVSALPRTTVDVSRAFSTPVIVARTPQPVTYAVSVPTPMLVTAPTCENFVQMANGDRHCLEQHPKRR